MIQQKKFDLTRTKKNNSWDFVPLDHAIPVSEQEWDLNTVPFLSISCITFNHEKYVRNALDAFLNQKTTFPVEILIHDDASTDKTAEIIREYETQYPKIIKPIYQEENQYSKRIKIGYAFQYPRVKGKYYATCEGDDYWTDPDKLQKQVSFLEKNLDYQLTCGGYITNYKGEKTPNVLQGIVPASRETENGFTFELTDLRKTWITKTLTLVVRFDMEVLEEVQKYRYTRDVHLVYHLLKDSKGYYFKDVFGLYNIHSGGVHSQANREKQLEATYRIYKELYEFNKDNTSRWMYRKYALALFNYRMFHNADFSLHANFYLWKEAMKTTRNLRELKNLVLSFISEKKKNKIKVKA